MSKRTLSSILILSMLFVTMSWFPIVPVTNSSISDFNTEDKLLPPQTNLDIPEQIQRVEPDSVDLYSVAGAAPADGILDPVLVEQSGYPASENISARTDTFENLGYDLPLDEAHNWVADLAEVSVWNLEKLYAVNGSYNQGFPGVNVNPNQTVDYYPLGWDANSNDTATYSDDVQLAAYDDSGRQYVMVESQGGKVGQNAFGHVAGTRIVWTQTVQNAPYTENFLLNFDYFYLRGPLDKNPGVPVAITGNCSITVSIDGSTVWNMSLLTLAQRGVWTDSGVIPITIIGAPSSFVFEIGLVIDGDLTLDKRYDYDNNTIADGIGNAAYITVYLDDVSFIKATPPTAEQVQLEFATGGVTDALTGVGTYYASVVNSSYWTTSPVSVTLTSNTSVSFDYKTRLHSHRFTDSNWRTDISSVGVSYLIDHGSSSDLKFYTYVGYLGDYEDPEMIIVFPDDWENITVSDPFLTDLTGTCTVGTGYLTVPTAIIDNLGWWEIKLQSPNYAKSIKSQIFDGGWIEAIPPEFRIGNTTRADITIGTATQILGSLTDVNVSWFNPTDALWFTELRSGGALGQLFSSSLVFNSSSPAGEWWVEAYWTNGTEVAYDWSRFELHHSSTLIADPIEIWTDTGQTIKGLVRYTDGETSASLFSDTATLSANWSGSSIPLVANPVQNWWEADFDTSIIGAGDFVIFVTASQPYYDDASCQILVHITNVTRLTSGNAPWTAAEWGSQVTLTFNFESYHLGTDTWGPVVNNTDVSVSVNWTSGYWSVSEDITPGIYKIHLDTNIVSAGTWLLNTTFNKPYHESKTLLLTLILSPMTSSLTVIGNLSERVDLEQSTSIKLLYAFSNGTPISGGNVVVADVSPGSGLSTTAVTEVGGEPGNYTVTLTPFSATVYTIRFVGTGSYSEPASTVFVLVVNDVKTDFTIYGAASLEIGLTETYNTTFRYEMINGTGIENAAIDIVYSGPIGMLSYNLSESGLGNYTVKFAASLPGTYLITIAAFKQYHQGSSDSFFLTISNIPANLTLAETNVAIGLTDTYDMSVRYEMYNGTGIAGADIEIVAPPEVSSLVTPLGLGDYNIEFSSTMSGTFLLTVVASKQYHQSSSDSFILLVREISTNIASLNGTSGQVGFGYSYELFIEYTNSTGFGLDGATVSIESVTPSTGLTWDSAVSEGLGVYSILFTPIEANTYNIVVNASYTNHQTKYLLFALITTPIPTTLSVLNASAAISLDKNYTLYMLYQDEETNRLVNSTITAQATEGVEFTPFEEMGNGIYTITITPLQRGVFDLIFRASKPGYQNDSVSFTLESVRIQTVLSIASGLSSDEINYTEAYPLVLELERPDSGTHISNATIDVLGIPSGGFDWTVEEIGNQYIVYITPEYIGRWIFTITATLENHRPSAVDFILDVEPIRVQPVILSSLYATEGQPFNITVRLDFVGYSGVLADARVSYRLSPVDMPDIGEFYEMQETAPGIYSATHTIPLFLETTQYSLEIKVEKDNYEVLGGTYIQSFVKNNDVLRRATPFIFGGGTFFVGFIFLVGFMRIRSVRRKRQIEIDVSNKRRFDDADNIIGVIVMHKKSGIPIYSRIVKGGFEEGIVAAFISAVTHFREEFEAIDEEAMNVIPISDIIRAVQTRNLICAFITLRSASMEHNRKMEAFGQQVATYLDDFYSESRPEGALDSRIAEILDYVFDETMDGHLIKFYKASDEDLHFPKRYRYLEQLLEDIESRHCSRPVYLAQGVATFGVSEARGCTLVLEAIDKGLIEQCEEHEPTIEDMEFADFFKEKNNNS